MSAPRLESLSQLPASVAGPEYEPSAQGVGIVHFGLGAFHKAHQAFYTDRALALSGGDWKIVGVSLRSREIPQRLNEQNGLYTLVTRASDNHSAQVIASIDHALHGQDNRQEILSLLASPTIRIVTSTVTEKGYGIDRQDGTVDLAHSVIAADLQNPDEPSGIIGFLVKSLAERRKLGVPAFTVLCCDNLPNNGQLLRSGVLDFAQRLDPQLASWIDQHVPFPSSMVDRITPAPTSETRDSVREHTGLEDLAAVECEAFHQWIIEDNFALDKPDWAAVGAMFTTDVQAFERMKLRMLNGTHSLLAYAGCLTGCRYVRDVMQDTSLQLLAKRHLECAAATLEKIPGMDYNAYAAQLIERFTNTAIAHETRQIAMDGSQKLPQRLFSPALDALNRNQPVHAFAFATALWMRFCTGRCDSGETYKIEDPLSDTLQDAATCSPEAADIVNAFCRIEGLFPNELARHSRWQSTLVQSLRDMQHHGVKAYSDSEAKA
ncbi:MAG: mannitol dehydrogenase family protein [Granulosicoccus sp.]